MSCGSPLNVETIPFSMRKAAEFPTAEPVWEWFKRCKAGKAMRIELVMNGAVIHRSSFPICRTVRDVEPPQKRIEFSFTGGHVFQGEYHTMKTQRIEASFWQAGVERDSLLLGVSFTSENQILLNTIHVANVNRTSASEIDRGIIIRTYPSTIIGETSPLRQLPRQFAVSVNADPLQVSFRFLPGDPIIELASFRFLQIRQLESTWV
jgi:hypothetical protein